MRKALTAVGNFVLGKKPLTLTGRLRAILGVLVMGVLMGLAGVLAISLGWAVGENARQLAAFAILCGWGVVAASLLGLVIWLIDVLFLRRARRLGAEVHAENGR